MVLLRRRGPEHGDDRVADELLQGPAAERDLGRHGVVEPVEHVPHLLGVERAGQRGRPHQVGEQHGGQLSLPGSRLPLDRGRAHGAEPGALREGSRTLSAGGHGSLIIVLRDRRNRAPSAPRGSAAALEAGRIGDLGPLL